MPKVKFTKSVIDALPPPLKDIIYWDSGQPGFGVKVTPKGRKVFVVLYRVAGTGSRVRKYTIGPLGQVTLHQRGSPRNVCSQLGLKGETLPLKNSKPAATMSQIRSEISSRRMYRSTCPRTDQAQRLPACCGAR